MRFDPLPMTGYLFLDDEAVDTPHLRKAHAQLPLQSIRLPVGRGVIVHNGKRCALGIRGQVLTVRATNALARCQQGVHVALGEPPFAIRWDVQHKHAVATDRSLVDVEDLSLRAHALMAIVAIEPAVPDRGVDFRRQVVEVLCTSQFRAAPKVVGTQVRPGALVGMHGQGNHVPFAGACLARLVATPAYIWTFAEDQGFGGQFPDQLIPVAVRVGLSAFALGMGAVKPDFVDGAILGKQLKEMVEEILIVVVHLEGERPLVFKRAPLDGPGNRALRIGTAVAVEPVG